MLWSTDNMIRIHNSTNPKYKLESEICAKDVNWCILDIAFSPCGNYFVYSTWSPCSKLFHSCFQLERFLNVFILSHLISLVNLSPIEGSSIDLKPLLLEPSKSSFCIFSLAFTNCGEQIIGGGSDGCLYIYDLKIGRRTLKITVSINLNRVHKNIFFI